MRDSATLEKTCKALGNGRRLEMIRLLKIRKHATVGELAGALSLSDPSTSKHLSLLERAGILVRVRRGMSVIYRLSLEPPEPARIVLKML